jgi:anti-sigma regulatory factor (Ser/Thr protein kinase)/serine/threonine protein phosphatase PrpC
MAEHLNSISSDQQLLDVRDASGVAEARRVATRLLGQTAFFNDVETANVALVATELSTNLIKHAQRGVIVVRLLERGKDIGFELMALDQGAGIRDLAQSMRDGYSTAGSSGNGFGAIKRLASQFDIHSIPGKGTAILARFWAGRPRPAPRAGIEFGVVHLPMPGQEISGDGWGVEDLRDKYLCTVVDGLGHGPDAAIAAQAALAITKEYRDKTPAEMIERAHGSLRSTRGAAMAVAAVDLAANIVCYCAVGNISTTIVHKEQIRHLVSLNGIVGQEARKITEFTYPWSRESLLVMHSDGLSARWDLKTYPALVQRDPSLIAAVLYRDFSRGRDDATVLVARETDDPSL